MENRINDLEVRIAYQDKVIEELNSVVIELRGQIDFLARKIEQSEEEEGTENLKNLSEEVPPPHY